SIPSRRTAGTISRRRSNCAPSCGPRQAAPVQKRVAPRDFARAARSSTSATVSGGAGCTRGAYHPLLGAVGAVLRAAPGLDAQQGTALDVPVVVGGLVDLGGPEELHRERQLVHGLQLFKRLHGVGSRGTGLGRRVRSRRRGCCASPARGPQG